MSGKVDIIGLDKPVARERLSRWAEILVKLRDHRDEQIARGAKDQASLTSQELGISRMPSELIKFALVERHEGDLYCFNKPGYFMPYEADSVLEEWLDVLDDDQ